MAQVAAHARSYTPEWRYEGAEDDPGSALAELFGDLFYQTVDRMNSVPGKLHTEFLNLTGFQMPDPVPAAGLLQFTAHDTVEEPVPVPEGTQVFTPDEEGENVVYETVRSIQSTPARLTGLFYVDARAEVIQRLDLDRPQPFFTPAQGENLQRHRFTVSQSDVLALSGPFQVEAELRLEGGLPGAETAQRLSDPALARWTFHSGGAEVPFSRVRAKGDTVVLDYDGTEALEADGEGNFSISCWGQLGAGALVLDGVGLRSRPAGRVAVDSAANGDIPLDLEAGGYCFGRRPAAYGLCYFRSDQVFRTRGSRVNLHLEVAPIITNLADQAPHYQFNQRIIDKRDAVVITPDDVYVSQVLWEYFNGTGWRPLTVSGNLDRDIVPGIDECIEICPDRRCGHAFDDMRML